MTEPVHPPLPAGRSLVDPPPEYRAWRAEGPLRRVRIWGENTPWLVTGHAEASAVLADPRFSSDDARDGFPGLRPQAPPRNPGLLLALDPPDHTRLRRTLIPEFTFRRVQALRPAIERIAGDLVDDLTGRAAPADLVEHVALPLPSLVICELLGVPYEDHDFFQRNSRQITALGSGPAEMAAAIRALHGYLAGLLAAKGGTPGDDLMSRLAGRVAGGELTGAEAVGMASLLLVAGHETTASMIPLAVVTLGRHPGQLAALRKEPERWPAAVEELMRYLSVVDSGLRRIATEDVRVGGTLVRAGEGVVVALPAANRDPAVFAEPEAFDAGRDAGPHLGFGHGAHQCVGQSLARAELEIGLRVLFERLPELRPAGDADACERLGGAVHGVRALPVTW